MNGSTWASWRTLVFGLIGAIGAAVVGAFAAGLIEPETLPHWVKSVGVLMSVIGAAGMGFVARDDSVTSKDAGASDKPPTP